MFKLLLPCILILSTVSPANAFSFCHEPQEPFCLRSSFEFDSPYEYKSCKQETERYLEELRNYQACVTREVQNKMDEAVNNFNRKRSW